jgi:hypothetical protein
MPGWKYSILDHYLFLLWGYWMATNRMHLLKECFLCTLAAVARLHS